jgi:hypothetical protein
MEDEKVREIDELAGAPHGEPEPKARKALPSYRPWDWIVGYALGFIIMIVMFALAESLYHQAALAPLLG